MITNINTGVDPSRVQQNKPPYFVNYQQNGQNKYLFFSTVSGMYGVKKILENSK